MSSSSGARYHLVTTYKVLSETSSPPGKASGWSEEADCDLDPSAAGDAKPGDGFSYAPWLRAFWLCRIQRARPKSAILTVHRSSTSTFAGFKSR
eukprot:scaffold1355_cov268-Pinguiococcus_pyrenoidosus.AAC.23